MSRNSLGKIKLPLFIILVFIVSITPASFASWSNDAVSGLETAKKNGQLLLLQFYSETCHYCAKMEKEVLGEKQVEEMCEKIACVKVNASSDIEGIQLARKLGIRGYPTTVVMDGNGNLVSRFVGYRPLDVYTKGINGMIEKNRQFHSAVKTIKNSPDDVKALSTLAENSYSRKDYVKSLEYSNRIIKNDPDNSNRVTDRAYIIRAFSILNVKKDHAEALKSLDTLLQKWPESKLAKNAMFIKAVIHIDAGNTKEARTVLLSLKKKYPNEKELNSYVDSYLEKI
jgi:thioredoxin-related protein